MDDIGSLELKDFELLSQVNLSKHGKLFIYKNDQDLEALDDLWASGYLFRGVSWFNKDFVYELTKAGERLLSVRVCRENAKTDGQKIVEFCDRMMGK